MRDFIGNRHSKLDGCKFKVEDCAIPWMKKMLDDELSRTMEQMQIHTGDDIQLIYMAESEDNLVNASREFLLTRTGQEAVTEMTKEQEVSFQVPMELLKDAGIPLDEDLDIVCRDGRIIILPAEEDMTERTVPKELITFYRTQSFLYSCKCHINCNPTLLVNLQMNTKLIHRLKYDIMMLLNSEVILSVKYYYK